MTRNIFIIMFASIVYFFVYIVVTEYIQRRRIIWFIAFVNVTYDLDALLSNCKNGKILYEGKVFTSEEVEKLVRYDLKKASQYYNKIDDEYYELPEVNKVIEKFQPLCNKYNVK